MANRYTYRYFIRSLIAVLVLALLPVLGAAESIYDTNRVVGHSGNECSGVPNCISYEASRREIKADQVEIFAVNCPDAFPYIWNWDAEQNEHIFVNLIARSDTGLTFSASNLADVSGYLTTYVGCSSEPFEFTDNGYMLRQGSMPSLVPIPYHR